MKTLLISQIPIWPIRGGAQVRLDLVHESLTRLGQVRVLSIESPHTRDPFRFNAATGDPIHLIPRPEPASLRRLRWWTDPDRRPIYFFIRDARRSRAEVSDLISADHFDAAWFSRIQTYHWFADLVNADLKVVDVDDLEADKKVLEISDHLGTRRGPLAWLRRLQGFEDSRRWQQMTEAIGDKVRVVACSADDARKLGELGLDSHVVPNCYRRNPGHNRESLPDTPIVLMQGNLAYPPNARGAEWLVNEVWPRVRLRIPEAELRLVGRSTKAIRRFADHPGVKVLGFVDDISLEVESARVCVAPIHSGGGTRIKILEAIAHRRPVVSTTVGAAGLGMSHEQDILLADDPGSFAENVTRVLLDGSLAHRLSESGFRIWSSRYTHTHFFRHVAEVVSN